MQRVRVLKRRVSLPTDNQRVLFEEDNLPITNDVRSVETRSGFRRDHEKGAALMIGHKITLKGFRLNKKTGRIERIPGYGLDESAKQRQRSSKKTKVVRRKP